MDTQFQNDPGKNIVKPFQIMTTNNKGEIVLMSDQLELLKKKYSSGKKVVIFAVSGGYRIGKSSMLNILFETNENATQGEDFEVSDKRDACTKGIWVKCIEQKNKLIVALDTEGTGDPRSEKDQKEMLLMTILSMAICSEFIVNTSQTIDDTLMLGLFNLVSCCENYIAINEWQLPNLRVLVRDYKFNDAESFSPDEMLEDCLSGNSFKEEKSKIKLHLKNRKCYTLPYYEKKSYETDAKDFWKEMKKEGAYFCDGKKDEPQTLEEWTKHVTGVMIQLEKFRKTSGKINLHLTCDAYHQFMVNNLKKQAHQDLANLVIVKEDFQLKDDFRDIIDFPNAAFTNIRNDLTEGCEKHVNELNVEEIKVYMDGIQSRVEQAKHISIKRCFQSCIAFRNGQNFLNFLELSIPERKDEFMNLCFISDSSVESLTKEGICKHLEKMKNEEMKKKVESYYHVFFGEQVFSAFEARLAEIHGEMAQSPSWLTKLVMNNIRQLIGTSLETLKEQLQLDISSINIEGLKSLLTMLNKEEQEIDEYSRQLLEKRKTFKEGKVAQLKKKYMSSAVSLSSTGLVAASLAWFSPLLPLAAGAAGASAGYSLYIGLSEKRAREKQEREIRDIMSAGNTQSTDIDVHVIQQGGKETKTTNNSRENQQNVQFEQSKKAGYMHIAKSFMSGCVSFVNTSPVIEAAIAGSAVKAIPYVNGVAAVAEVGILVKNMYNHKNVDEDFKGIDDMIKCFKDRKTDRQDQLQLVLYYLYMKHMEIYIDI